LVFAPQGDYFDEVKVLGEHFCAEILNLPYPDFRGAYEIHTSFREEKQSKYRSSGRA
jgi:hypothetical protein